jgi:hypothetical protein
MYWLNYEDNDFFLDETPIARKMLISIYFAVLMLGANEMGPVNMVEMVFVSVGLIITSLANAQIFGEMAVLISTIERKKTNYQSKLDKANVSMGKINLPIDLQEDIREYIIKTMGTRDKQEETDQFFEIIAPSFKVKVNNKLFESNLRKNITILTFIGETDQRVIKGNFIKNFYNKIMSNKAELEKQALA